MLGGTIPDEDDNDVIAEQLAKISEQMAIKNRRSKKIWKIAGVIFLVIVLLNILLIIFNMSVSKNVSTDSSTTYAAYPAAAMRQSKGGFKSVAGIG